MKTYIEVKLLLDVDTRDSLKALDYVTHYIWDSVNKSKRISIMSQVVGIRQNQKQDGDK